MSGRTSTRCDQHSHANLTISFGISTSSGVVSSSRCGRMSSRRTSSIIAENYSCIKDHCRTCTIRRVSRVSVSATARQNLCHDYTEAVVKMVKATIAQTILNSLTCRYHQRECRGVACRSDAFSPAAPALSTRDQRHCCCRLRASPTSIRSRPVSPASDR